MAPSNRDASRRRNNRDRSETATLVIELCKSLDSKLARKLSAAIKTGNHSAIPALTIDPSAYSTPEMFQRDWLAVNVLRKYPLLDLGIDTAEVAFEGFRNGELQCGLTNKRLRGRYETPTLGVSGESLIESARQKISSLLPLFSWDLAEPFMGFSSGASTRLKRTEGDAYYKFQGTPEVTRRAALLACCAIERVPSWARDVRSRGDDPCKWVKVVNGSRITTVPKNAKTDRIIAIEPCMNMYLQRGIGGLIRQRLRRVGIDLDDQTRNQRLALSGSLNGSLATIDLKAASDTISTAIVERLLPREWFDAMDLVRSEQGTLPDGSVVNFQKFSSMGNGFTFELESLIFWALSSAVVDQCRDSGVVAVYGDDIIVPSAAAGFLVELLSYCGFEINTEKTFVSGPFRESCGKHYFLGVDVTPFQIQSDINSTGRLYWFANSLRRWASRPYDGMVCSTRYKAAYDLAVSCLPSRAQKVFIPEGVGDGGLISTFDQATPSFRRSMWSGTFLLEGVGKNCKVFDQYMYLRAMSHGGCGDLLTTLVVSRSRKWYKWKTYRTSQWCDAPLWV